MSDAKLRLLKDTLDNEFSIERFQRFTREFFNGPDMLALRRDERIWLEYKNTISAYYKIASYEDGEGNKILILAVELKKGSTVERARSLQRNFISKILDGSDYEAAIVAFYTPDEHNWRLSLVRLDYTITTKGVELELTPAKRFSYLVGKNEPKHTAIKQLFTIFEDDENNPTLDRIEEAFSVEKVTKDFFNEYKAKYLELKEYLEKNEEFIEETNKLGLEVNKFAEQFAKKLMGQLAFLYFLQKKGWLGVRILPPNRELSKVEFQQIYNSVGQANKNVLDKVFKQSGKGTMIALAEDLHAINDYEAELLSDCFVNTRHDMPWGTGDKNFIRGLFDFCNEKTELNFFDGYLEPFFYDALNKKRKNHYFKRFNCKIPFLNGGLFEPIEGYHWEDINFNIPNNIFSNKNEKGRDADGILDIFDMYNFTMNEDEPLEKEVAIDPEMLGKIFENLLDVSDRKSKGAFYTPREIVHYMCQESLINYLVNKVGVPYEDMKEFILYGEMIRDADSRRAVVREGGELRIKPSIYENIVAIDEALKNVKVADPAVGSGAFPLGMLNEIVKARNNITEYIIKVNDKGEFGKKYEESFIRARRSEYKMKWDTIKNSIFAVDIEPSAVDIAKLRLWLSVVVDQEIDENNPQPHPLPNLDQNIMVGNSLIDEFEGIKLFDESLLYKENNGSKTTSSFAMQMNMLLDQSDELLDNMFKLQDRYFGEDDEEKKKEIKAENDRIRDELIRYKLQKEGNTEGLKRYEESLKNKTRPYFIWELEFAKVFKESGGFDIVIGNPPYVGESGNKDIFRPIARTKFGKKYYQGKMDLFYFFFHIGLDIGNDNSEIAFITTNYYTTAFGARNLRQDLKERSYIRKIINFNELKIFESAKGQHNMITTFTKKRNVDIDAETCLTNRTGDANSVILNSITSWNDDQSTYYRIKQSNVYEGDENYIRLNGVKNDTENSIDSVLSKISDLELRLGNITEINQGLVSGCDYISGRNINKINSRDIKNKDGIFVLDLDNNRDLNVIKTFSNEERKLLRPFYKNSEIEKYYCNQKYNKMVLYLSKEIKSLEGYHMIKKHLDKFTSILNDRREVKTGKIEYFHLQWARRENIFTDKKIVVPYRTKKNTFAYNDVEWFCRSDVYVITQKDINYNLKYILALLNSKPYYIWLYYKGKRKGEVLELFQVPLSEIPIKKLDISDQEKFVFIVDKILNITNKHNYLSDISAQKEVEDYEGKINQMIYSLYGFTDKEIDLIENHYQKSCNEIL